MMKLKLPAPEDLVERACALGYKLPKGRKNLTNNDIGGMLEMLTKKKRPSKVKGGLLEMANKHKVDTSLNGLPQSWKDNIKKSKFNALNELDDIGFTGNVEKALMKAGIESTQQSIEGTSAESKYNDAMIKYNDAKLLFDYLSTVAPFKKGYDDAQAHYEPDPVQSWHDTSIAVSGTPTEKSYALGWNKALLDIRKTVPEPKQSVWDAIKQGLEIGTSLGTEAVKLL